MSRLLELIVPFVIIGAVALGFSLNIYKLFKCDFAPPYKEAILRGAGIIVVPMGIVEGYMTINK